MKEHMAETGCPSCDGHGSVGFGWDLSALDDDNELWMYVKRFHLVSNLRVGQLFRCPSCEQHWYLNGNKTFMTLVPADRLQSVEEWNSKTLQFSDEDLLRMKEIGATPPDLYGNGKGVIEIPCEVTDKQGNTYKQAFIRFQSNPPIDFWRDRWRLSDEIESFRASEYCLNQDVRLATSQAEEMKMGFCPTRVQDKSGNQYVVNWTQDFVDCDGLKGKDIILSTVESKEWPPRLDAAWSEIEYFIADYSRDLEFLYIGSDDNNRSNKLLQRLKKKFGFFTR